MTDVLVPTNSDNYWGPEAWQLFDYYRNPTSIYAADGVTRANPLLMIRHASGWTVGSHQYFRSSDNTELFHFVAWLLGNDAATVSRTRWDVCSFTSGQQKHQTSVIPRSRAVYGMEAVRDCQRGIASIKALAPSLGFNPRRVISAGESSGATLVALAQLAPPTLGSGSSTIWREGSLTPNTWDSSVRGVIFSEGVIDLQSYSGTDYFDQARVGAFLGTGSQAEFDAVSQASKAALSVRQYFVSQDLASYAGMYIIYNAAGDGVKPLGYVGHTGSDPHDSIQFDDLTNAARTAGVQMFGKKLGAAEMVNLSYPSTSAASLAVYRDIERWMTRQVSQTG